MPIPHFMRFSSVVYICSGLNPSFSRFWMTNFIIMGGPQVMAMEFSGLGSTSIRRLGTKPTKWSHFSSSISTLRQHSVPSSSWKHSSSSWKHRSFEVRDPYTTVSSLYLSRLLSSLMYSIIGRRGACPMPPPTVTMFLPSQSARGNPLPKGPRTVMVSPASSWCRAEVTLPISMIEKRRYPFSVGEDDMQNMDSPTPRSPTMAHCPGSWLQVSQTFSSAKLTLKVLMALSPGVSYQASSIFTVYGR